MKKVLTAQIFLSLTLTAWSQGYLDQIDGEKEIILIGEIHGVRPIYEEELKIWTHLYKTQGLRHLILEQPYYTAEILNLWMKSPDDTLLDEVYQAWEGSLAKNPGHYEFYKKIKAQTPQTIFHGVDVGHQHQTLGARYLAILEKQKLKNSPAYKLTQETIEQGKIFSGRGDDLYRETKLTENFLRELAAIEENPVVGIFGGAHIHPDVLNFRGSGSSMAMALKIKLGDILQPLDLTQIKEQSTPLRTDQMTLEGVTYKAQYFGTQNLRGFKNYDHREFWLIENAYRALRKNLKTGNVLPFNNYPMEVPPASVFRIDYTTLDGTRTTNIFINDGGIWNGLPTTEEILIKEK